MWMKSRFAQWEVEGQVRERVTCALHEAEQGRLVRTAQGAGTWYTPGQVLGTLGSGLSLLLGWAEARLRAVRSWVETPSRP
jgi:hypothetical protein